MSHKFLNKKGICITLLLNVMLSLTSCMSNASNKNVQENDYTHGCSIESLDVKFDNALKKIKSMLPMAIDDGLYLTDLKLETESIVYCCKLDQNIDASQIDWNEYDRIFYSDLTSRLNTEQGQLMIKFCYTTGRDIRYKYYTSDGAFVHEQVINPNDYLTINN